MSRALLYVFTPLILWFALRHMSRYEVNDGEWRPGTIAIATTIRGPEPSLTTWLDYHLRRIQHILIYMDDPQGQHEIFERLCRDTPEVTLRNGSQKLPEMSPESRVILRQQDNTLDAIAYLLERGYDWLLHIDVDEVLYERDEVARNWSDRQDVGYVHFTNHEALPLSGTTLNAFLDCTWFRLNKDGGSQQFMAYGNGKSAVRLSQRVTPSGPHAFTGYRGEVLKPPGDELMILHYPTPTYERWVAKFRYYGEFSDYWYSDPKVPNRVEFMLRSRDVVQEAVRSGDWAKARKFWDERVMVVDGERWREDVEKGRIRRYEPFAGMETEGAT